MRAPMNFGARLAGIALLLSGWIVTVGPAGASETITHTYDARGRLVQVTRTGTVNNGVSASYLYDKADNRTNKSETDPTSLSFAIGNGGPNIEGGTFTFTVTKSGSGSGSVNYATANGTATAPADYTATSGTLTFGPTDTSKTISVVTINDALVEDLETMFVNLSGASGGSITTAQGFGKINDNDFGGGSFSAPADEDPVNSSDSPTAPAEDPGV
jgi:hypothetical protein